MDPGEIEISTDRKRLDLPLIQQELAATYWAAGRSLDEVQTTIDHSVPFGMYSGGQQIGFARVLTDFVVFAYLMDVIVLPAHRGQGHGTRLVRHVLDHPDFSQVQLWLLRTRDAHPVYTRLGFQSVHDPENLMALRRE